MFDIDFIPLDEETVLPAPGASLPRPARLDGTRRYDLVTLLVTHDLPTRERPGLFSWLRKQAASGAHICGGDAAPLLLAEAGLLNGYRATMHWSIMPSFRERHPEIEVVEQLFVTDRNRSTCAGQVALLDFSMSMLKRFCGETMCSIVGNEMLYNAPRPAETSQREIVNEPSWTASPVLLRARDIMRENLEYPLSIEAIAQRCSVSRRELQYLFQRYLNGSPKQYYMAFRLQHAKELLLYSSMSVRETGLASGFSSPSAYFRAFHAHYGSSPRRYREEFAKSSRYPYGRRLY